MWLTLAGLVATGRTMDRSTPAWAIEAASSALEPWVKGVRWLMAASFSMVAAAMAWGKVWVWMSTIMKRVLSVWGDPPRMVQEKGARPVGAG